MGKKPIITQQNSSLFFIIPTFLKGALMLMVVSGYLYRAREWDKGADEGTMIGDCLPCR